MPLTMHGWTMWRKGAKKRLLVIASCLCALSTRHAAVDAFTSRANHQHACEDHLFSRASGDDIGGIEPLPDEISKQLASRHPRIARQISRRDAFVRSTDEWFSRYLGLSKSEQKRMNSRWPNCAKCVQRTGRRRLHVWLAFFLSEGLDHDRLKKMIISRPQLLSYKLSNMQSTTAYFRGELGLSSEEFASLLKTYPSVLMHSIDKRLRPNVDFLQNECGGGKDNWASWKRVVCSYPSIFSKSLERTLLPKINFLCGGTGEKSLGLKRPELSQAVAKFPPILWLSEQNLQSKLDFLSKSLDLTKSELRTLVVSYPQMLGLSLDNLEGKVNFFLEGSGDDCNRNSTFPPSISEAFYREKDGPINCGLSKDQLKDLVLYQPALLAYSLENRIKPRIRQMQEKYIFFYYCPKNLMSYTDVKFDSWLSTQVATWSVSE